MTRATQTRREFLQTGASLGASLVIAFYLPPRGGRPSPAPPATFKPNAWLEVHPDGTVRIWTGRSEMGQGVKTAMPMIVAEELDVDWQSVRVIQADANPAYGNQMTVGSRSVQSGWEPLRKAGAAARAMLISAAALTWGVPPETCRAAGGGMVRHTASGRQLRYGQLTERAASLPLPENPPLKPSSDFRIVGTRVPRVDSVDKVTGKAQYGMDVRVPGMAFAAVARCPVFGGRVRRFDAAPALAIPGVRRVEQISRGVAVVADNTWAAFQGKQALRVEWDEGDTAQWSTESIRRAFAEAARRAGQAVRATGDVDAALAGAARTVDAVYEAPYLAHACMEPMNCTAHVTSGKVEIWAPTQNPQGIQREAARVLGLPVEAVTVHVTYLGGGFGRRGGPMDYANEAIELAAQVGRPIQVVWTREDDIQNGLYRPATYNVLRAGLDASGRPVAWSHKLVGPDGASFMITRGADELIYAIPNFRLERVTQDPGIPIAPWRGVGPSQNGFIVESFVDELAHAAGKDPYAFRRDLAAGHPRLVAVLDTAARAARWGTPAAAGRHRGIALWQFGETSVAEVAEVSVKGDGSVRVHRVVCAIDCGVVVNPDTVEAQTQSNIVYGLTAALFGHIDIDRGRVVQSNFHDYRMLRLAEMPEVEVHLVRSDAPPGGVGEAALPALAPAVCNAIFAATGKRIRRLPILSLA
ncbi:MAG TPA: xanthine dehydrogenase family protein molybdopterin-binding subunit [Gemmatimonadales bacterium]|jgi:isoquinoline 1-oxidoreductase beta subunit|nr:xanthine dehydrogenase family protein molybdopterin-binding subunit [Gemmatimonadales bacterium]